MSIGRIQGLGFSSRLLEPVSDHVLINRVSKGRALHQVINIPLVQFDR